MRLKWVFVFHNVLRLDIKISVEDAAECRHICIFSAFFPFDRMDLACKSCRNSCAFLKHV